jgi:hypothetical protein
LLHDNTLDGPIGREPRFSGEKRRHDTYCSNFSCTPVLCPPGPTPAQPIAHVEEPLGTYIQRVSVQGNFARPGFRNLLWLYP